MEVTNAQDAYNIFKTYMTNDVEEVWAIALNSTLKVIETRMLFRGTVDSCQIHPRDVFRFACLSNASHLVLAHNHPSGDVNASIEDLKITRQLIEASKIMQIPIIDHLILTDSEYSSMAKLGIFSTQRRPKRKGLFEKEFGVDALLGRRNLCR